MFAFMIKKALQFFHLNLVFSGVVRMNDDG